MNKTCIECGRQFETKNPLRKCCDSDCEKAHEIWESFRRNEIDHDEVQRRLNQIPAFYEPKGFFKNLDDEIKKRINDKFSWQVKSQLSPDAYLNRAGREEKNIVTNENFIKFFEKIGQPTQQDNDDVLILNDYDLEKYHIVIFRTLINYAEQDLENSPQCQNLHEYYRLTRQELCNRGLSQDLGDAFLEYCQNKSQIQQHKTQIKNARVTGSICIFCGSNNVRSYNKEQWKCYDCGKRFRKH